MRLLPILLLLAALLGGFPSHGDAQITKGNDAQTAKGNAETPSLMLDRWDAEADFIDQRLTDEALGVVTMGVAEIDALRSALESQLEALPKIQTDAELQLGPLRRQLDALGDAPGETGSESEAVAARRAALTRQIADIEERIKRSGQIDARADALIAQLTALRRELFSRMLLTRGPYLFERAGVPGRVLGQIRQIAGALREETAERIAQSPDTTSLLLRIFLMLVQVGFALFLAIGVKRIALRLLLRKSKAGVTKRSHVMLAVGLTLVRLLIPSIGLATAFFAIWNSGFLGPLGQGILSGFALATAIVIGTNAIGGVFFSPHAPQLRLSRLPEEEAVRAHHWMMVLAVVIGLDRAMVAEGETLGFGAEALTIANGILLILGGIALWGFTNHLGATTDVTDAATETAGPSSGEEESEEDEHDADADVAGRLPPLVVIVRLVARTAAILAPILALMGYYSASRFVFHPVVASGAVIGICVLLFYVVDEFVGLVATQEGAEGEPGRRSRIRLIPIVVGFLLFSAATPLLALIWGASNTDLFIAWRIIADGIQIGDMVISPVDFFSFVLVFSVGYMLARIVQRVINRSVLPLTGLDSGGRAAVSTGVFYLGVVLAALVAISATGLDLSNLAIVAGALSVGIGFGLQNIVNNFVSGLILLIERPIKAGDWVEITSGMGYVRKINVRSTEIQTFDRASLIVPNSELISGPVTNWTHTNLNGRLKVPVGVAYGTDPKRVETILTEIANAHPMLLRRPAPYVLFLRFGADALEFEIRGVLRDVNWILNVTSDINFEISRRFAEEGIEIPFAQRDLHIRNADELGRSISKAMRGGQEPEAETPKPAPPSPPRPAGPSEAAGNEPDGDY